MSARIYNIKDLIKKIEDESIEASKAATIAGKNGALSVSAYHSGYRDACNYHIKKLKNIKPQSLNK